MMKSRASFLELVLEGSTRNLCGRESFSRRPCLLNEASGHINTSSTIVCCCLHYLVSFLLRVSKGDPNLLLSVFEWFGWYLKLRGNSGRLSGKLKNCYIQVNIVPPLLRSVTIVSAASIMNLTT